MTAAALSLGFTSACMLETKELVFNPDFRKDCEENYCGNYGKNYTCPPSCGSVDSMRARLLRCPHALMLVSVWDLDWRNGERLRAVRKQHNEWAARLMADFPQPGGWQYAGASGCLLCDPCGEALGLPCRFPEQRYSCLSAYCVDVRALAERCGVEYFRKDGRLSFFSLCAF